MLYRLFTENKNKDDICRVVSEHYDGFTVFETIGYWQGKQENSLCIEILTNNSDYPAIVDVCNAICYMNEQDCVLVQKVEIDYYFT